MSLGSHSRSTTSPEGGAPMINARFDTDKVAMTIDAGAPCALGVLAG